MATSELQSGHLDQYAIVDEKQKIFDYLRTAFKQLYDIEEKLNKLYLEMSENYSEAIMSKVSKYQEELEKSNFYGIDSEIQKVASGLGINAMGMDTELQNLSGGQSYTRKIALAKPRSACIRRADKFLR